MIVQTFPYILFRSYPTFGYLTDNRNYGYDTASYSCLKVGELLLSKTGSIFYSVLNKEAQDIKDVLCKLHEIFSEVPLPVINKDAIEFYTELHSKGFVYLGEEDGYASTISKYFSYGNKCVYDLCIHEFQKNQMTYTETLGKENWLTRIHLDISSGCNENCVHCYIPNENKRGMMSREMFDRIIRQCRDMNVLNITISGGEPMLNPWLKDFLQQCIRHNFSVNLLSNLTLLEDDLLETIACSPLICVQTSLYAMEESVHDSITRKNGSFRKTLDGIMRIHKRNIPMQINCPIMKQNKNEYRKVLEFAKSMNIEADADYSLFGSYDNSCDNLSCRLSVDEIREFIREGVEVSSTPNKIKIATGEYDSICPVCKHSMCISNTGNVYPCEGWQSLKIGDVNKHSLKDIWENGQIVLQLRDLVYKDFPKCNSCEYKSLCSICLIMNANESPDGNYKSINTFVCEIARIKAAFGRKAAQE